MKFYSLATIALIFSFGSVLSQPSDFGDIDIENLKQQYSSLDSTTGAEVIFDYGETYFDRNFEVAFRHHVRLKIYNSTEFDRGDIKIPYAEGDRVEKFKASTYNLVDGQIVESELTRKETFSENVREGVKQMRFSLENIKEGSIIEYTYIVNYGGPMNLNSWYFQQDIPVRYSEYVVEIPEYFTYQKTMTGYVSLADVQNTAKANRDYSIDVTRYIAKNVPAFVEEPYMDSEENYISKISYELDKITVPGQVYSNYLANNYMHFSREMADKSVHLSKSLEKNKFLREDIDNITKEASNDLDKVKALYYFVRDSFEIDTDEDSNDIRRLMKIKKSYASNLNRVLIALLKEAGFKTELVRLSTRKNGKLNPIYPFRSGFNHSIALVTLDQQEYLLDASVKDQPFNILPEKCLNDKGLVISETNPRWVDLSPKLTYQTMVLGKLQIEDGVLKGEINDSRSGYAGLDFIHDHKEDISEYKEDFSKGHASWQVSSHEVAIDEEAAEPKATQKISCLVEDNIEDVGNLIYVNPLVYGAIKENPFKLEDRLFPVDYGAPVNDVLSYNIEIPEGYVVDELPEAVAIGLPNKGGVFIFNAQVVGNFISVNSKLQIKKTTFVPEEYPYLRAFYTQISAKHGEQIVLKKKS